MSTEQNIHAHRILILDFGSQYTQLIARRVREIGVFCEIRAFDMTEDEILAYQPKAIILAGGPESVTGEDTPRAPECVFTLGVPVLGICYGMQTMAEQLGGSVEGSDVREFGYAQISSCGNSELLSDIKDHVDADGGALLDVWMSHGDKVSEMPQGFELNIEQSWLGFELSSQHNEHQGRFNLQQVSTAASTVDRGFFADDQEVSVYTLQLHPDSHGDFSVLQRYLGQHRADNVAIRVVPKLQSFPATERFVTVWIDVQLSQQDGFFTLVDGAQLALSRLKVSQD